MQRHNTPLSLCALSVPPQLRRRADAYRESMDAKVAEDTAPVHWSLDEAQTKSFLAKLFPDERLFNVAFGTAETRGVKSLLSVMEEVRQRENDRWKYYPDPSKTDNWEEGIADFFNDIIRHTPSSHMCTRQWTGKAANKPLGGLNGAVRKPDLLLCEEGVIRDRIAEKQKFDMRTDIYAMGEVKKRYSDENKKDAYIELAGKVAFLLEVQDGRYAAPGIQLVGNRIVLTFFDRGGSISTYPLDIHKYPEEFLRIILGITFADGTTFGFDTSISPAENGRKRIQIILQNNQYFVSVDTLLFFSGTLHGRGTTVWSGTVTINEKLQEVVVKDTWVDPLRKYTEGRILKILEAANVKGVPRLVHEQQVQTEHPVTRQTLNHSTHILRSLIGATDCDPPYNLRVLSRMVSQPRGYPIFEFTSLAELLVALADCLCAHRDAVQDARILHRDISLFNLFLVLVIHSNLNLDFIQRALPEPQCRHDLEKKILQLPRRGLLGDWGFGVPMDDFRQASSNRTPEIPAVRVAGQSKAFSPKDLCDTHSIVIPVVGQPLPNDVGVSIDASPLQRTGTWAWMAAELSHIGPGKPVVHEVHHDLESFFYILLAVCLLYDKPGSIKPAKDLANCFDPFFAITEPSTVKIVTVQSDFGWTALMIPYISPYFQPLIPLLEKIRNALILPIKLQGDKMQANKSFTHNAFIDSIVTTLSQLPESSWLPRDSIPSSAAVVPQSISASSGASPAVPLLSSPGRTFRLSGDALQRVPPIRIPGTSSTNSAKRRFDNEVESSSRLAKRRSPASAGGWSIAGTPDSRAPDSEVSSNVAGWVNVDGPDAI